MAHKYILQETLSDPSVISHISDPKTAKEVHLLNKLYKLLSNNYNSNHNYKHNYNHNYKHNYNHTYYYNHNYNHTYYYNHNHRT